jgi:RNA-directed DNA polymerase
MHAGNGQLLQFDKSRQLQRRLYLAAKKCRERRFHALYDRIFRLDVLWRARQEVKTNGGSAGVDGVSLEEVERQGVAPEIWLRRIAKLDENQAKIFLELQLQLPDRLESIQIQNVVQTAS